MEVHSKNKSSTRWTIHINMQVRRIYRTTTHTWHTKYSQSVNIYLKKLYIFFAIEIIAYDQIKRYYLLFRITTQYINISNKK